MQGSPIPRPPFPEEEPKPPQKGKLVKPFGRWPSILAIALGLLALVWALDLWLESQPLPVLRGVPTATAVPAPVPQPTIPPGILNPPQSRIVPPVINRGTPPTRKPQTADPDPSTAHFIVVDGDSGAILFQQNAFEPIAPASLTKIMTAVLAIEHGGLSDQVKVNVDAASFDGSDVLGLKVNTQWSVKDLLYGMMLLSGNDAALAIGRYVAGSDKAFVKMMNDKAAWLKLGGTHFANDYGFDSDDHYSCPADMVTLARYAMQYPLFRDIVSSESYQLHGPDGTRTIRNVNDILTAYPGADGVKTGDTPRAGRASVATAVRDGHRVYVSFMRSGNGAVADGVLLLNWAFDSHSWPSRPTMPDRQ